MLLFSAAIHSSIILLRLLLGLVQGLRRSEVGSIGEALLVELIFEPLSSSGVTERDEQLVKGDEVVQRALTGPIAKHGNNGILLARVEEQRGLGRSNAVGNAVLVCRSEDVVEGSEGPATDQRRPLGLEDLADGRSEILGFVNCEG